MKNPEITFLKDKKENLIDNNYIFIPRHWTRYSSSKQKG